MSGSEKSGVVVGSVRRLAVAGAVGLGVAMMLLTGNAQATEPTRQTVEQVLHSGAPCPSGVVLQGLFDVTRTITTFYDSVGSPVAQLQVNRAVGTWTNPNSGASLDAVVVRQIHTDLITGESFSTGSNSRTFLPGGGGVAIGAAGLQVFDASGHLVDHFGPDSETERAQLCAALGA
jgi:hypothetical protein